MTTLCLIFILLKSVIRYCPIFQNLHDLGGIFIKKLVLFKVTKDLLFDFQIGIRHFQIGQRDNLALSKLLEIRESHTLAVRAQHVYHFLNFFRGVIFLYIVKDKSEVLFSNEIIFSNIKDTKGFQQLLF